MKDGLIQQVATPQNLYDLPVNVFVTGFIGTPQMNFVNCRIEKDKATGDMYFVFGQNKLKMPPEKATADELKDYVGKEVIIGIRPECLHDEQRYLDDMPDSIIEADVEVTELMGSEILMYIVTSGGTEDLDEPQNLVARVSPRSEARAGDKVKIAVELQRVHVFDKDTERCIIH
jgi:multiple sugar transport system ATP-binding protein